MNDFKRVKPKPRPGPETLTSYIPPQDIEAEQSTLGAMLIERAAIDIARTILPQVEDFYRETHQTLYAAILAIRDRDEPVDLITLQAELKAKDKLDAIGGISYLAVLYDRVPTAVNVEYYAKLVQLKAVLRRMIAVMFEGIGLARGAETMEDTQKAMALVVRDINNLYVVKSDSEQLGRISERLYGEADDRAMAMRTGGVVTLRSIAFPFRGLQRMTGGMQDGLLYTFAGCPSMGKTSLVLFILLHAAFSGYRVLFESLETTRETITQRCICMIAAISFDKIRKSHALTDKEWMRWDEATTRFNALDFEIDQPPSMSPRGLAAKCREMERHGRKPDIVAVDYVQLMDADEKAERRDLEVQKIVKGIKVIAREMRVPMIGLSQVNRAVEARDNKRPHMGDSAESSAFGKDSDVWVGLYREAYYAKRSGTVIDPTQAQKVELIVDKNKDGPTKTEIAWWTPECGIWEDGDENAASLNSTVPDLVMTPSDEQRWPNAEEHEEY